MQSPADVGISQSATKVESEIVSIIACISSKEFDDFSVDVRLLNISSLLSHDV